MTAKHAPLGDKQPARTGARPLLVQRAAREGPAALPSLVGNQAMLRLSPNLVVGAVNDPHEREADRVAEQVMRMPAARDAPPDVHTSAAPPRIQRLCSECAEEREAEMLQREPLDGGVLQAKSDGPGIAAPATVQRSLTSLRQSGGRPLPGRTRRDMETRFGRDLSGVRIHTDGRAAEAAAGVRARAFTVGRDVVFGAGEYAPGARRGRHLLAHELTHVLQQGGARADPRHGAVRTTRSPAKIARRALGVLSEHGEEQAATGNRTFYWAITNNPSLHIGHKAAFLKGWPAPASEWPFTDDLKTQWNKASPSNLQDNLADLAKRMTPFITAVRTIQHAAGLPTHGILNQATANAALGHMKGGAASKEDIDLYHGNRRNFYLTHPDRVPKGSHFTGAAHQGLLAPPQTGHPWPYDGEWIKLWNALSPWPEASQVNPDGLRAFLKSVRTWQARHPGSPSDKPTPGVVGSYEAHYFAAQHKRAQAEAAERAKERAARRAANPVLRRIDSLPHPVTGARIAAAFSTNELRVPSIFQKIADTVSAEYGDKTLLDFLTEAQKRVPAPLSRSEIAVRNTRVPTALESGRSVGLFPIFGATVSTIPGAGKAATVLGRELDRFNKSGDRVLHAAGEFFNGLMQGLSATWTKADTQKLFKKLLESSAVQMAAPVVFLAGTATGILEQLWAPIKKGLHTAWSILKALRHPIKALEDLPKEAKDFLRGIKELVQSLLARPRFFGFAIGLDLADKIHKLLGENAITFTFELGRIVGPVIVGIILSVFGFPEIAGADVAATIAEIMKALPGGAKLVELLEAANLAKRFPQLAEIAAGTLEVVKAAKAWVIDKLELVKRTIDKITGSEFLDLKKIFEKLGEKARKLFARLTPERKEEILGCKSPCKIDKAKIAREIEIEELKVAEKQYIKESNKAIRESYGSTRRKQGYVFNETGFQAEQLADDVLGVVAKDVITEENKRLGSSVIDRLLRKGRKKLWLEVKRSIPEKPGKSFDRIVKQIKDMVDHGGRARRVVWSVKKPTPAAMRRLTEALGDYATKVEFRQGVGSLAEYLEEYFH